MTFFIEQKKWLAARGSHFFTPAKKHQHASEV